MSTSVSAPTMQRFAERANYGHYSPRVYERNITRIIAGYRPLHGHIAMELKPLAARGKVEGVELGVGTGLTAKRVLRAFPNSSILGLDILEPMVSASRQQLARYGARVRVEHADYFQFVERVPAESCDFVYSAISVHHAGGRLTRSLVRRVFAMLKPGGLFALGDLMDFEDAAKNLKVNLEAMRRLIANATSRKVAVEWLDHWLNLNKCTSVEAHLRWFVEAGFVNVRHAFECLTTNLVVGEKPV